ncbi:MAG: hypothetical protein WA734_06070 [Candidatus Acidiferrales bacterium]
MLLLIRACSSPQQARQRVSNPAMWPLMTVRAPELIAPLETTGVGRCLAQSVHALASKFLRSKTKEK